MKKRSVTYSPTFCDKHIITSEQNHLGCDKKILNEVQRQFNSALADNSKTFFFRFDIRFPSDYTGPTDNSIFSKFQSSFIRNLARHGLNPRYIAVREQSK